MSGKEHRKVIRFQVDDFTGSEKLKAMEALNIGNVRWLILIETTTSSKTNNKKYLSFRICCKPNSLSNLWSCDAFIRFSFVKLNSDIPDDAFSEEFNKKLNRKSRLICVDKFMDWEEAICKKNKYLMNNQARFELEIVMKNLVGIQAEIIRDFSEPNGKLTDVVLIVEGKEVHVGKQILAEYSKFFHALFYSDFAENSQKEVVIGDVVHSEFVDFLNMVYLTHKKINSANVGHILKLADRFGADFVIGKCENFLISNEKIHVVEKFKYAQKYKLSDLQDSCLNLLTTPEQCCEIKEHKNYDDLEDNTCKVILDKLMDLIAEQ